MQVQHASRNGTRPADHLESIQLSSIGRAMKEEAECAFRAVLHDKHQVLLLLTDASKCHHIVMRTCRSLSTSDSIKC